MTMVQGGDLICSKGKSKAVPLEAWSGPEGSRKSRFPDFITTVQGGDLICSKAKSKAVPLQAWSGPEGSRKSRLPDFMTTVQGGDKDVSPTHRPHLSPGNPPGTQFCYRLSRPQGHSAASRIMSMKNSNDTIWNRNSDLPICSTAP